MKKIFISALCATILGIVVVGCDDHSEPRRSEWIDPAFARILEERYYISDANTVTPSDIASYTYVNVSGTYENPGHITSLKGIEYFTSLEELYCEYNNIEKLDISSNNKLKILSCGYNKLTQLDVSNNTQLTALYCSNIQLTQLDVSNNTQLTSLSCHNNQLTQLDVSNNTQLEWLYCHYNKLTQLDISNNTHLYIFYCYGNPGENGQFRVKSWFDNNSVPYLFSGGGWKYDGAYVEIDYYK